jgi:hypothetical protein
MRGKSWVTISPDVTNPLNILTQGYENSLHTRILICMTLACDYICKIVPARKFIYMF